MTIRRIVLTTALCLSPLMGAAVANEADAIKLARPDPGIGQGFANAMAGKFNTVFGVNRAEADCLVYEVVTRLRETRLYNQADVEVAKEVAPRCGLNLGG